MTGRPRNKPTTTKHDLSRAVARETGRTAYEALVLINALFIEMREQLIQGNRIEVRGFGVLDVKEMAAKPGARNPRTGEIIYVPPHRRVHFKPGRLLKEALHEPLQADEGE